MTNDIVNVNELERLLQNCNHSYRIVIAFDSHYKIAVLFSTVTENFVVANNIYYYDGKAEWDYGSYHPSRKTAMDEFDLKTYNCSNCDHVSCPHRGAYRRHPVEHGGLGLCER